MKWLRILMGAIIWVAALGAACWCLAGRGPQSLLPRSMVEQLRQFAVGPRRTVELDFDFPSPVRPGDPIFVLGPQETARQVGEVTRVSRSASGVSAQALFYCSAPALGEDIRLDFHQTPNSMTWVLNTMLPEEKRLAVAEELKAAFAAHQDEILAALRPVVEQGLRDAFAVVEQDLPAALARRRERLQQVGDRYQQEIVQRELVPLLRNEIWPIVLRHGEPLANEVGQEIWERASLWRFGWRYAYDRSPLPDRGLTEQEWRRFVRQEAVPVLERHVDDFVQAQQRIFSDVARNPRLRAATRRSLGRVLEDPEVQRIARDVVQEVVADNPRMHAVLRRQWRSEQARDAFQIAAARFEPSAVRIGELLLGTPEDGITPEFARVLRNQVLGKDRRWLVLEIGDGIRTTALPSRVLVTRGAAGTLHPFVRESLARDPLTAEQG